MIQFPAVVLPHSPILSDHATEVDLLMNCLVSKAVDGETVKVDDQVEMCAEKILDRGGQVGEVFKDNSLSAWNPKVVRPQWDALMARLEAGLSDGVMVYDLTRFSRKILEGERLVELAANGVRVWALAGRV